MMRFCFLFNQNQLILTSEVICLGFGTPSFNEFVADFIDRLSSHGKHFILSSNPNNHPDKQANTSHITSEQTLISAIRFVEWIKRWSFGHPFVGVFRCQP